MVQEVRLGRCWRSVVVVVVAGFWVRVSADAGSVWVWGYGFRIGSAQRGEGRGREVSELQVVN